jgi:hypothetical protein
MSTQILIKSGGGSFSLQGTNYLSVLATGTPTENGAAVRAAYTAAQAMTPNGAAKSATNRVVILLAPGYYDFNEGALGDFNINQSFIDFESLSGVADVYFSSMKIVSTGTGKNIRISGIDTTKNSYLSTGPFALYTTGGVNESIYIRDCIGGDYSFGAFSSGFKGTIDNCVAGSYSFGYTADVSPVGMSFVGTNPTLYGTYKNCVGGNYCFLSSETTAGGGAVENFGTIENCRAGSNSFLYAYDDNVNNAGTIHNCRSTGSWSFCVGQQPSVVLLNQGLISLCTAVSRSFVVLENIGGFAENYGKIVNCLATGLEACFVVNALAPTGGRNYGLISDCNAYSVDLAFCSRQGLNYGFINNCIASSFSFCCDNPSGINSDIYRCTMSNDTFTVAATGGGRVVLGIDTTGVVNY